MKSLFPILTSGSQKQKNEIRSHQDSSLIDWMNIGSSFITNDAKLESINSQNLKNEKKPENPSGFFNIENRVKAKDLIEFTDSSEEEIKEQKKESKSRKYKKEKKKKKVFDLMQYDDQEFDKMLVEYIEPSKKFLILLHDNILI